MTQQINKVRTVLGLLSSMVYGGESHTEQSEKELADAYAALDEIKDPWHYVEDGDLPETFYNTNGNIVSEEVLFKDTDNENDVGWLTQLSGKYYWEAYSTHDMRGDGMGKDLLELNEVKCWMPIPEIRR